MNGYVRLGRVRLFHAPIYVHWSAYLAVVAILAAGYQEPAYAVLFAASYFGMILLHEFGHAYLANKFKCRVHEIRVTIIHGICEYEVPFNKREDAIIAWGGVLAQFAVALPLMALSLIFDMQDLGFLRPMIVFLGYVSVAIAIVNLAPSPHLDGSKAWGLIPMLVRDLSDKRKKKNKLRAVK